MNRTIGTASYGVRCPIFRPGDDLSVIVPDCVIGTGLELHDRDVVAVTESVVARTQGNFASIDAIAKDVRTKTGGEHIGLVFPIQSRNRFAICLRGIAKGAKKITLMMSYPSDEVGNPIVDIDKLYESGLNPYTDVLSEEQYRKVFGKCIHQFTGVDYVEYYGNLIRESGAEAEIIFGNNPQAILSYTDKVIACDIHTRFRTKELLRKGGAKVVLGLDDILSSSVDGSGYNEKYGLLGTNKSTEDTVKLFPRDCQDLVEAIQAKLYEKTGKRLEVMVYGDGAFKDPVEKIWELADPVVSPAYTAGLKGMPNELKLKYLADNEYKNLSGEELNQAVKGSIKQKSANLWGTMASQGTTPRQLTDLLGTLSDLTSGSGDKGTPVVLIQGYFDNLATE